MQATEYTGSFLFPASHGAPPPLLKILQLGKVSLYQQTHTLRASSNTWHCPGDTGAVLIQPQAQTLVLQYEAIHPNSPVLILNSKYQLFHPYSHKCKLNFHNNTPKDGGGGELNPSLLP